MQSSSGKTDFSQKQTSLGLFGKKIVHIKVFKKIQILNHVFNEMILIPEFGGGGSMLNVVETFSDISGSDLGVRQGRSFTQLNQYCSAVTTIVTDPDLI